MSVELFRKIESINLLRKKIRTVDLISNSAKTSRFFKKYIHELRMEISILLQIPYEHKDLVLFEEFLKSRESSKFIKYKSDFYKYGAKTIWGLINTESRKTYKAIEALPNGVEKAEAYLKGIIADSDFQDGLLLDPVGVDESHVFKMHKIWKRDLRDHLTDRRGRAHWHGDYIFWMSDDYSDVIDKVSYYRLYETFPVAGLDRTFKQVENQLSRLLLDLVEGKNKIDQPLHGKPSIVQQLWNLWLISRSNLLCNRLHDVIQLTITDILNFQHKKGYWYYYGRDLNQKASVQLTAFASAIILRVGSSPEMRNRAIKAATWLVQQQNEDGSWEMTTDGKNAEEHTPSVFITMVASEALERAGYSSKGKALARAKKFILEHQELQGEWNEKSFVASPYRETFFITEYLLNSGNYPRNIDVFQGLARDYIFRAKGLIHNQDSQSCRTAVMLCFEGIEMFFYSILARYEGRSSFVNQTTGETIGVLPASNKIFRAFHEKGMRVSKHEKHEEIKALKELRNKIVHRGESVSLKEALKVLNTMDLLVTYYSVEAFGFNLLS